MGYVHYMLNDIRGKCSLLWRLLIVGIISTISMYFTVKLQQSNVNTEIGSNILKNIIITMTIAWILKINYKLIILKHMNQMQVSNIKFLKIGLHFWITEYLIIYSLYITSGYVLNFITWAANDNIFVLWINTIITFLIIIGWMQITLYFTAIDCIRDEQFSFKKWIYYFCCNLKNYSKSLIVSSTKYLIIIISVFVGLMFVFVFTIVIVVSFLYLIIEFDEVQTVANILYICLLILYIIYILWFQLAMIQDLGSLYFRLKDPDQTLLTKEQQSELHISNTEPIKSEGTIQDPFSKKK